MILAEARVGLAPLFLAAAVTTNALEGLNAGIRRLLPGKTALNNDLEGRLSGPSFHWPGINHWVLSTIIGDPTQVRRE